MSQYEKAWQAVVERVARAAQAAGRAPADVQLLAVSKTFPADAIRAVYALGQRAFGENYVQEAVAKIDALRDLPDVEWHMIGPMQSNKTASVASAFDWVETVDRLKIAQRLALQRSGSASALSVCIEVNASGEPTKSGVAPDDAVAFALEVARLPRLRVRGIMGIPEATADTERLRRQFAVLRHCFDACRSAGLAFDTLSMGMSADLEAAIAEGATQVRVGTAIFGVRGAQPTAH